MRKLKSFIDRSETGRDQFTLPDYAVDTIIDVGVAGGTPWLYQQFPHQNLVLIEPLNVVGGLKKWLAGRNYEMHECAVGAAEDMIEINYDTTRPSLSSIKDRTALTRRDYHKIEKRTVPVRRLDEIMQESKFSGGRYGLKIDTEGYELEVLKGATDTLKNCAFIVCEASIAKRFEDGYDFNDLIVFMDSHSFKLVRVLNFAKDGAGIIRMADLLFEPK